MSDAIQLQPISPTVPGATVKRGNANVAVPAQATATDQPKAPAANADTAQALQPLTNLEPATYLTITRDTAANTFVYRSVDSQTGVVVWQYPMDQVLRMAHRLRELEGLDGHQVDKTV